VRSPRTRKDGAVPTSFVSLESIDLLHERKNVLDTRAVQVVPSKCNKLVEEVKSVIRLIVNCPHEGTDFSYIGLNKQRLLIAGDV